LENSPTDVFCGCIAAESAGPDRPTGMESRFGFHENPTKRGLSGFRLIDRIAQLTIEIARL